MSAIGDPQRVELARARRDAELTKVRREGYEAGVRDAAARHCDQLSAARGEHAEEIGRLDARHAAHAVEIRGAAYWRGKVIGGSLGIVIGAAMSLTIAAALFSQNERALHAGAGVAQQGMTAGLAIEALKGGEP